MSLTKATQATGASPSNALTTPFIPPTSCSDEFLLTTNFTRTDWSSNTETSSVWTVFASAPGASGFAGCQPSGWDPSNTQFSFSPAVCPSAWTVYQIGLDANGTWGAKCCSSGFYLQSDSRNINGIPNSACVKTISNNMTTSATTYVNTVTFGTVIHKNTHEITSRSGISTLMIHNAWHISWDSTDVASLSPSPPIPLCSTSTIASWTPGESLYNNTYLGSGCENRGSDMGSTAGWAVHGFLLIGLPVIIGLILICCCAGFIHSHRKKRRQEMSLVAAANLEASQAVPLPEIQAKTQQTTQEVHPLQEVQDRRD